MLNTYKKYFLSILLVIFYLFEGIGKVYLISLNQTFVLSRHVKLFFFILFIIYLFKIKKKSFLYLILCLFIFFIIGQLNLFINYESFYIFLKYLFFIVFLEFGFQFLKKKKDALLNKYFELIILFNSILILVGFIFKITYFYTYNRHRFGFNGLILTSSSTTYIYIIALYYFLVYKKLNLKSLLIVVSVLLIGTKSLYLVLVLIILYKIYLTLNKKYRLLLLLNSLIIVPVLGYLFVIVNPETKRIYQDFGIFTSIISYRDKLLVEKTIPYVENNWSILNYLFGGIKKLKLFSQFGFIDLYIFAGLLGAILYLYLFYKSFIKVKLDIGIKFFIIVLFIIVLLSGNFFYNTSLPIYFIIIQQIFLNKKTMI